LAKRRATEPSEQGNDDLRSAPRLKKQAQAHSDRADELEKEVNALRRAAKDLWEAAAELEIAAKEAGGAKRGNTEALSNRGDTVIVDGMNTAADSHALKISRGKSKDPLSKACVNHRMTFVEMVERVRKELKLPRLPSSGISLARRGERPIRRDVAEAIERLVGFAATKAHWPKIRDTPRRD
jgi:hypothetical protein